MLFRQRFQIRCVGVNETQRAGVLPSILDNMTDHTPILMS